MIARIWHGVTPAGQADDYFEHLNATSVPGCQRAAGNRGVYVLRRLEGTRAHFMFVSFWDTLESARKFAGSQNGDSINSGEPKDTKGQLESGATHYEVLA